MSDTTEAWSGLTQPGAWADLVNHTAARYAAEIPRQIVASRRLIATLRGRRPMRIELTNHTAIWAYSEDLVRALRPAEPVNGQPDDDHVFPVDDDDEWVYTIRFVHELLPGDLLHWTPDRAEADGREDYLTCTVAWVMGDEQYRMRGGLWLPLDDSNPPRGHPAPGVLYWASGYTLPGYRRPGAIHRATRQSGNPSAKT
jgi:hypothetical protein